MSKSTPKSKEIMALLEDLAKQLDIVVRYEKTAARGGLCRHNDKYHIIIDSKATDDFKIELLRESLRKFDFAALFISPKLRDILEMSDEE